LAQDLARSTRREAGYREPALQTVKRVRGI
jgi:hypothetical protein